MVTPQAVRRWIMTGAVAGITVTGTIYGAGLKTRQEYNQVCSHLCATQSFLSCVQIIAIRLSICPSQSKILNDLKQLRASSPEGN